MRWAMQFRMMSYVPFSPTSTSSLRMKLTVQKRRKRTFLCSAIAGNARLAGTARACPKWCDAMHMLCT